ncbi:MAG TPA: hypothetical protein VKT49_10765 [Bryobacteraceae bacterium]|nr:hypothetical protein [Bryobacteraceae bacterium]
MNPAPSNARTQPELPLRHILATLVYRAAKVLRDAPPEFSGFRPATGSRSAGEILAHIGDLLDWALSQARGQEKWRNSKPQEWAADAERFFAAATALDQYLASSEPLHVAPGKLFQGALADALTHIGQIAMLRRLAGVPVRGENYSKAHIEIGRTGADQNRAVQEFD